MSNLGFEYIGESTTFNKSIVNHSGNSQNASYIKFSITDASDVVKYNTSNVSNIGTGVYTLDVYLHNNSFSEGSHYSIFSGNYGFNNKTYYFYYQDHIYIEDNKLL